MSFHIPGDIPDLQSLHLEVMDHSLATVVPSKVAFIPHEAVRTFLGAHPLIPDVFWRDTLIDAAVFREWVVNGLITTPEGGRVVILDWPGLQTAEKVPQCHLSSPQEASCLNATRLLQRREVRISLSSEHSRTPGGCFAYH